MMILKGRLVVIVVAVVVVVSLLMVGVTWWLWANRQVTSPWYYGIKGYNQAQQQAASSGKPLLYLLEGKKCRRCELLDKLLWRDPAMAKVYGEVVRVRLKAANKDGSELVLSYFPKTTTLPGVYLQESGGPFKPIKIVPDIQQVWMPGVTWQRGYFMPLSPAAFAAVVHTTLALQDPAVNNAPLE
ncbi:thioredoxin family protein [Aeromonas salmonicida]|uniref:thioredoxin family protein n=1 Tax=Aeromonas salmonicida TaxID=645 RepID=UPI002151FF31|nr:thioredoxin family protein [Aeromonas salmonicida]